MALTAFAGVFSRYFVVGFFSPVFFLLVLLDQLVDSASLPTAYRTASGGTQIAILGGVALLGALLLSGVHYHVIRAFEGYPIQRLNDLKPQGPVRRALRRVAASMVEHWNDEFEQRNKALEGPKSPARTRAARELNRYFPWRAEMILPTRFGNTIRAFETHANKRYGLDGVTAWTRIGTLLTESEREAITEAQSDVAFFVNLTALLPLGGFFVVADLLVHPPSSVVAEVALTIALIAVVTGLSWSLYQAAVGAAVRWGMPVRAAFDMHRLELYSQLGLKHPRTDTQERNIARAATRCMLYGEPLDETVRNQSQLSKEDK
jgi:hypothetical protein